MKKILRKFSFILPIPSTCYPDDSAGTVASELWWTNLEFSFVTIVIPPWFSTLTG
jgi:hypothetical protein